MTQPQALLSPDAALDLMQSLPVGILLADQQGTVLWVNDALCAQFQCTAAELIGRSRHELPAKRVLTLFKGLETYHVPAAGEYGDRWLSAMSRSLSLQAAGSVEAICTIDITHYEKARKRRHLSLISNEPTRMDPETGLLTEESITAHLVSEISRSRRYHNPLSLILLHFGRKGAPSDDQVGTMTLPRIARFLKERLRWVDITGCWRDHGILVVLPETHLDSATQLADKLRAGINKDLRAASANGDVVPLPSIGVTEWRKGDDAVGMVDRLHKLITGQPLPNPEIVAVA